MLDAFTSYKTAKREKTRFSHLTDSLRQAVDPEYITICLALINALVNSPEDIDDRVSLRNEFLRLGIDVVLASLKKSFHVEDEPDLHTQVDVFEVWCTHPTPIITPRSALIERSARRVLIWKGRH